MQTPTAMPATVAPRGGMRSRIARAIATSSAPPTTIRAAPTATGDALGPIACAVPVVPKQTAARRTCMRAGIVGLLNNSSEPSRAAAPIRGKLTGTITGNFPGVLARSGAARREALEPPPRDVEPAHEPHTLLRAGMRDESADRRGPRRLPRPPRMRDHRHHRRALVGEQLVEADDKRVEVVARTREPGRHEVPRVLVGLRVRDDQHRAPEARRVVGQVVVRRVGVIEEAALLDEQLARVLARARARVPPERPLAEHALERLDRPQQVLALLVARLRPRLAPAPAVAEEVVTTLAHPVGDRRIELQSGRDRRHGDRHLEGVVDPRQAPDPRPRAVLVVRLGAEGARRRLRPGVGVLAPAVVAIVAVDDVVLGALLVDEHEIDGDARAVGPAEPGRQRAAVADEVAGRPAQYAIHPPSTSSDAPLTYVARSEARNATASATSSGRPSRANGVRDST